jgi:hypothetical protein
VEQPTRGNDRDAAIGHVVLFHRAPEPCPLLARDHLIDPGRLVLSSIPVLSWVLIATSRLSLAALIAMPVAIYDGEIDGNKITFTCQDPGHDRTIRFTGIVNGDDITFTRTVLVKPGGYPGMNGIFGASGAAEFTAHRAAPSGAASPPTRPD